MAMNLTAFESLKRATAQFGANPIIAQLDKALTGRGINIDPERLAIGKNGIYYIDPHGALTRTVVHIVDMNVGVSYAKNLKESVERKEFESEYVLDKIHKYHLVKCKTIEAADSGGWKRHKYHMSRNQDGSFFYRFIEANEVLHKRENQKLYVCKYCLGELSRIVGKRYSRESFNLKGFLSSEFKDLLNILNEGGYADECAPNIYKDDWGEISKAYRNLKNYRCENSSCPHPDLSASHHRMYLHTHHISFEKSNNNYSNLKALCIYCHSNQLEHAHIKKSPEYKKYTKIRGISQ